MEVAVNVKTIRIVRVVLTASLAGAALLSLGACGDMLTYAQDAKRAGIQQYADGDYPAAVGSFQSAARQDPRDADTEYRLGLSYEQVGSYHEAVVAYKTCLALLPSPANANYNAQLHENAFNRLSLVVALKDPSNVETDLIIKEAHDGQSASDYQMLGRIFRYRGDADTAIENYRQAISLDPENFGAAKEFGIYLVSLSQNQDATVVLRDAYRLNQNDSELNAALQKIGMVPGPDLMAASETAHDYHAPAANNLLPDPTAVPAGSTDTPTQADPNSPIVPKD